MKRVYVRWEVTEEHRGEIEVPDDWSPETGEDDLIEAICLAGDTCLNDSYFGVVDRAVLEVKDAN